MFGKPFAPHSNYNPPLFSFSSRSRFLRTGVFRACSPIVWNYHHAMCFCLVCLRRWNITSGNDIKIGDAWVKHLNDPFNGCPRMTCTSRPLNHLLKSTTYELKSWQHKNLWSTRLYTEDYARPLLKLSRSLSIIAAPELGYWSHWWWANASHRPQTHGLLWWRLEQRDDGVLVVGYD